MWTWARPQQTQSLPPGLPTREAPQQAAWCMENALDRNLKSERKAAEARPNQAIRVGRESDPGDPTLTAGPTL